jgi:UDP-N-acetylmuramoyl-tripeptide--D-alanyl-D-alanine ligase
VIALPLDEVAPLGELRVRPGAEAVTGVKIDSRAIEPGDLFVAVNRGVDYLGDARAHGAAATLVPHDAFAALAALGSSVRGRSAASVVAITGSMGKTSTKDMLAALCRPAARTVAAERSYNAELGVPLTLCRLEPDTEVCILELAMRGFGQIAALCEIARPDVGVITNVGPVHLEFVGDLDGVIRAKSELVAALPAGAALVVPADFPVDRSDLEVTRIDADVDARVEAGRTRVGGVSFNFTARHQAENATTALAALDALGLPRPERVDVEFSRWRGEEHPLPGGGLLINDAYNANPVSMRAALAVLAERAEGRRQVTLLGGMAELGTEAPRYHAEVGRDAAEAGVEVLVAVGELARGYLDGAVGVPTVHWVPGPPEALEVVRELLEPGDCVLVKGSRALGLETVAEALAAVPA